MRLKKPYITILLLGTTYPIEGVIQAKWKDVIRIQGASNGLINPLRTQLRCKGVGIEGASRYRNQDEDLSQDYEEYFQALKVPLDVEPFIAGIKQTMKDKLDKLHEGISNRSNDKVAVTNKVNNG
ncbi:hypothetical protein R0K30_11790 [Bacillus sp. SIMBA_154]|uniref:hypothetical protein n=1 Tax=Bacillus sp. SIMBA_154 TaxID=3080859 RepID=UPI00397BAFEC